MHVALDSSQEMSSTVPFNDDYDDYTLHHWGSNKEY